MNETHFINGHEILEIQPDKNGFEFEREDSLYKHALEHLIALHDRERWDDLEFFQRNAFHRTLKIDSLQQICQESVLPVPRTTLIPKYVNKRITKRKQYKPWENDNERCDESRTLDVKLTQQNFQKLQNLPEFVELVKCYQETITHILNGGNSNDYPHYHILKSGHVLKYDKIDAERQPFIQIVKLLDSQNGLIVIASVTYLVDTQTGIQHFTKGNKYVIVSGYRYWRSNTQVQRERKFVRMEKNLYAAELAHDRKYQKVVGVQKHFPDAQYHSQNIGEEITS